MNEAPPTGDQQLFLVAGQGLISAQFHDLLKLRIDVFVVEQECPYHELDGLDLLPSTSHVWFADGQGPTSALRVLDDRSRSTDPPRWRIGRVVTRHDCRGQGLASATLTAALEQFGAAETVLEAQSYLHDFYVAFGYGRTGSEYVEDGIPHIPMSRPGTSG